MKRVDVLAIAAHPDDVELICGGTLIRAHMLGRSTGILDLAAGEMASRGTPELRAKESAKAAKVMGVSVRENLELAARGARVARGVDYVARILSVFPEIEAFLGSGGGGRRGGGR